MPYIKKILVSFFYFLVIFLPYLFIYSVYWAKAYFNNIGISEMMFTLSQPVTGSDNTQILDFLKHPFLFAVLSSFATILIFLFIQKFFKNNPSKNKFKKRLIPILASILLIANLSFAFNKLGFKEVKAYFIDKTKLYDTYYVDPKKVKLTFPEKKRNLIYIFVESLESSYSDKENGGAMADNLIPNLTNMALHNDDSIQFSNSPSIGGALQVPGVGFTVGGIVAQTSGIPIVVRGQYEPNDYGSTTKFLPGAYSLGDVLQKQNYKQVFLLGSDAAFAGRDKYFTQHGNYELRDYHYAVKNGLIPKDYAVWWGYEDLKLFEFAKQTLTELSEHPEQPFNFTMLTADTHFPDGFANDQTPNLYNNQYHNVIHFSDEMLGSFLSWIKEQPFYDNTTIVISGDHLTMDSDFSNSVPHDYNRTVYNSIINSPIKASSTKNRTFTTMDFYPTTLSALGVKIEGNRLGLGTNLYSETPTIAEKIGYNKLNEELGKRSNYYQDNIMKGSDVLDKIDTGQ